MTESSALPALSTKSPLPHTSLAEIPRIFKDPLAYLVKAQKDYGDIYTMNLGVTKVIVLNHPDYAQYVLQQNVANYPKGGALWDSLGTLLGNGLPVSNGEFWLRQRRMMQPQFHRRRLEAMTSLMTGAIDEEIARWDKAAASGAAFDISAAFNHITMRIIVRTMFGAGLSRYEVEKVSHALTYALDFILKGMITNFFPGWLPVPGRKRYQEAVRTIDDIVLGIIQKRRNSEEDTDDMITLLIRMVDDETGETMTDQQLRDEAVTLFLAGYETTAVALNWLTHFLLNNPQAVSRLRDEVDTVLGERTPAFADLPRLAYARMLIQEAMRLYPPVWWLLRSTVANDEIGGYPIPAGSVVAPMPYTIHRHPEFWSEPETFDPERFTPERMAGQHKLAWLPFGSGQRICIGKDFAIMEGQLVLASIVQRYDMTAVSVQAPKKQASITIRSKEPIRVQLRARP